MSCGCQAANVAETPSRPGGRGLSPGKCSILARIANKDLGDVLWVPGGER